MSVDVSLMAAWQCPSRKGAQTGEGGSRRNQESRTSVQVCQCQRQCQCQCQPPAPADP
jgi:hypothetical protein